MVAKSYTTNRMVETRKEWDKTSLGAGFRNHPQFLIDIWITDDYRHFFATCQVRVVRFYVSCLLLLPRPPPPPPPPLLLVLLVFLVLVLLLLPAGPQPRPSMTVFSVGPQQRPSTPSVPCRTSTTTIPAQCSLPDLNHDHPRPVFPAGPQPRVSPPSVPCRTSTTTIHAQCSVPDLNREYPRQKICHIECQKICQIEC